MDDRSVASKIGVALVDDDEAVLDSLKTYLERRGLAVTTFSSAPELLRFVDSGRQFDCVVTDVRMPDMSGVELQSALASRNCTWPLILITGHGDVGMAVFALKAGAADFIEKPTDDQRLLASIQEAVAAARERTREKLELTGIEKRYRELSERQREVMGLAVQGIANKEIAAKLGISPRTVEHYREHVMERMQAGTFAELVHMAVRLGLIGKALGARPKTNTGGPKFPPVPRSG
jgi:two-component system response regulator FixJ